MTAPSRVREVPPAARPRLEVLPMPANDELPAAGSGDADATNPTPDRLEFPDGLIGLPDLRTFSIAAVPETALFQLESLDDDTFGFIAARADDVQPGMKDGLRAAGIIPQGAGLLVFLSVHGEPPGVTANLAGPVVVDPEAGTARQIVLESPEYPLRAPLGAHE
jgi:flagellar assembly factor FliW